MAGEGWWPGGLVRHAEAIGMEDRRPVSVWVKLVVARAKRTTLSGLFKRDGSLPALLPAMLRLSGLPACRPQMLSCR